jgi:hypothetical protein
MGKVTVRLLKPLNGREIGTEVEYSEGDAKRLLGLGAVALIVEPPAKAARPPKNKMAAAPANKAADASPPSGDEPPAEGDTQG